MVWDCIYVNVLDLSLLQTLISRPGWKPALSSGGAGAELQHSDGIAGRDGGYCGRHHEELRSSSFGVFFGKGGL